MTPSDPSNAAEHRGSCRVFYAEGVCTCGADFPAAVTPLATLQAELDRTAVISESFKRIIMAWAYEVARDAYERGRASVLDHEHERVASTTSPKGGIPMPEQNGARRRRDGRPHQRVLARLGSHDLSAASAHFPTLEMKALYFANAIEAAACWPRVLAGTMEQGRFHKRTERMMRAILKAVA